MTVIAFSLLPSPILPVRAKEAMSSAILSALADSQITSTLTLTTKSINETAGAGSALVAIPSDLVRYPAARSALTRSAFHQSEAGGLAPDGGGHDPRFAVEKGEGFVVHPGFGGCECVLETPITPQFPQRRTGLAGRVNNPDPADIV